MRNCGAEFVRGVWRYHAGVDTRGAVRVSVLEWDGEVPVLAGRWDDDLGTIAEWSPELLAPEGMATESLASLASAALRREHDWVAPAANTVRTVAVVQGPRPAALEPVTPALPEAAETAARVARQVRTEPVQLALSVVMFGTATPSNADETGARPRLRVEGTGSGGRRPRRPGRTTRVG